MPENGVSKQFVHVAINLILPNPNTSTVLQQQHNVLGQYGFLQLTEWRSV
jgi:hypothetical protein